MVHADILGGFLPVVSKSSTGPCLLDWALACLKTLSRYGFEVFPFFLTEVVSRYVRSKISAV